KRLFDDLISDMWAVVVARVDVVHAGGDRLSQNRDPSINIFGRPPYQLVAIATRKLHRAVSHAVDVCETVRKFESAAQFGFLRHCFFLLLSVALLLGSLPTGEYLRMIRQSESVSGYIVLFGPNTGGAPSELPESAVHVELLPNHFFAFLPKLFGFPGIERIATHAFARAA